MQNADTGVSNSEALPAFTRLPEPASDTPATSAGGLRDDPRDEFERLRRELARRASEIEELRQDLSLALTLKASQDEQQARLEQDLAASRAARGEANGHGELERETLAATERALDARVRELASVRELLDIEKQGAETARREYRMLEEKLARVGDAERQEQSETDGLRAALSATQNELGSARSDASELQANLEIARETLEARREEVTRLRAEHEALRGSFATLEQQFARSEASLRAERLRAESDSVATGELRSANTALEETLCARDRENAALNDRLEIAERNLRDRDQKIANFEATLAEREREAAQQARRLDELQSELGHEREENARRAEHIDSLREVLAGVARAASQAEGTTPSLPAAARPQSPKAEAIETPSSAATETLSVTVVPAEAPPIYRYWRDSQLREKLAEFDVEGCDQLFSNAISERCADAGDRTTRVLSLAGPDSELEVRIATRLLEGGVENFEIRCLCSGQRRVQAEALVAEWGLRARILFDEPELAAPPFEPTCDVFLADGSLELASNELLTRIRENLRDDGVLLVAGRIASLGSGGPRAGEMGERIWALMPDRYKFDSSRGANRDRFEVQGLDEATVSPGALLRGLREHFHFELFAAFGHLANAFVGPAIGPNFDPTEERDRRFIDQVAGLDDARIASGALAPLSMVARLRCQPVEQPWYADGLTPDRCAGEGD